MSIFAIDLISTEHAVEGIRYTPNIFFEIYTPYSVIFYLKQIFFLFAIFLSERSGEADVEFWILLSAVPVRLLHHNSYTKELWPRHIRRTHSVTERFVDV